MFDVHLQRLPQPIGVMSARPFGDFFLQAEGIFG